MFLTLLSSMSAGQRKYTPSVNNAFEDMFWHMYPKVKAFAFKILQSEDDAEDAAQDIFVKLLGSECPGMPQESQEAYIFAVTRNHIFNILKHRKIEKDYMSRIMKECKDEICYDIYGKLYEKELMVLIYLTVENMPEQRRKIFRMNKDKGMTASEIAETLGLSVRTVERHIYLAMKDIRNITLLFLLFMLS